MQKLKPCPFCGGNDVSVVDEGNFSFIECADCLGAFYQREACCVEDNVEAWNKRTIVTKYDKERLLNFIKRFVPDDMKIRHISVMFNDNGDSFITLSNNDEPDDDE